ncbi:unannotated protein [freshwater metagenome]|uniref:Unannotated protein n=1 Tax=freshwater metagenome TaxID=449393 RepID=A0A6J7HES4_9ZZZZ
MVEIRSIASPFIRSMAAPDLRALSTKGEKASVAPGPTNKVSMSAARSRAPMIGRGPSRIKRRSDRRISGSRSNARNRRTSAFRGPRAPLKRLRETVVRLLLKR